MTDGSVPGLTPTLAQARRVCVLSGPTAVGKGTVTAWLRDHHPEIFVSVSATTRPPRPGEVDGIHYAFVTDAEFDQLVQTDQLLEWAVVHGVHRYGTPRGPVVEAILAGRQVVLEIDLAGARQIRASWPQARFVFLAPPTWDELVRRLAGRGTEDAAQQQRRLVTARTELAAEGEFDHVVVNGDVEQAAQDLVAWLRLCTDEGLDDTMIPDHVRAAHADLNP